MRNTPRPENPIKGKNSPPVSASTDDSRTPIPTVTLLGVPFARFTEQQTIQYILNALTEGRGGWVITPNVDILRRINRDPEFQRLCQNASLFLADGMPIVWASRIQGTPLPQRVAGSTLVSTLSRAVAQKGFSVFLLGGDPGTAEKSAQVLQDRSPNLKIAGTYCPPFGFEKDAQEIQHIKQLLTSAKPDIVFVALGSPKQEKFIAEMRSLLPKAWWLGVGISFSFLAGRVKRAPLWMQKIGLEWLHRLFQEPRRLAKRYLVDDLPFALRLLLSAFTTRLREKRKKPS
jgi:N-acetylglucosaminyldiphosphoundecaprenol N-acetyl-beta-D-mannosaminyltransferase